MKKDELVTVINKENGRESQIRKKQATADFLRKYGFSIKKETSKEKDPEVPSAKIVKGPGRKPKAQEDDFQSEHFDPLEDNK